MKMEALILISNLATNNNKFTTLSLFFLVICIGGAVVSKAIIGDASEEDKKRCLKDTVTTNLVFCKMRVVFSVLFLLSLLLAVPQAMIQTNLDMIKLRYTDKEMVLKLEKGALAVVGKIDKLIDKGIDSIGVTSKKSEK